MPSEAGRLFRRIKAENSTRDFQHAKQFPKRIRTEPLADRVLVRSCATGDCGQGVNKGTIETPDEALAPLASSFGIHAESASFIGPLICRGERGCVVSFSSSIP